MIAQRAGAHRLGASHGKPAELHREDQLQDQGEPEDRHGDAHERQPGRHMIEGAVLADRAEDAQAEGHDGREEEGGAHKLEGRRQALPDHLGDGPRRGEADAQIARHCPQPPDVLDVNGLVDPESLPVVLDDLGVDEAARLQQGSLGPSRRGLYDSEDDDRDPEDHRDHLQDTSNDVGRHGRRRLRFVMEPV